MKKLFLTLVLIYGPKAQSTTPREIQVNTALNQYCAPNSQDLFSDFRQACLFLINKSDICSGVKRDYLIGCGEQSFFVGELKTKSDHIWGCLLGGVESIWDLIQLSLNITQFYFQYFFDGGKTFHQSGQTISSGFKWARQEYEKFLQKTPQNASFTERHLHASTALIKHYGSAISHSMQTAISDRFQKWHCLNEKTQARLMCKFLGNTLFPPAGAFTLYRHGAAGFAKSPQAAIALEKLIDDVSDSKLLIKEVTSQRTSIKTVKANLPNGSEMEISRAAGSSQAIIRGGIVPGIEVSIISHTKAKKIMNTFKANDKFAWCIPNSGCWSRAHEMARQLEREGIHVGKIRADEPDIVSHLSPKGIKGQDGRNVRWDNHIAPFVLVESGQGLKPLVLDPALFSRPVSFKDWVNKIRPENQSMPRIRITNRFTLGDKDFESPPGGWTQEGLTRTKKVLEQLKKNQDGL